GASLTLPGIAGFILSIGMAVDANVLIFERIREEIAAGKTPRGAVSSGYHRAFSAIFDSNLTTLMTAVLLFMFGTGPVKGFAVTLSIGIIASMFSAILVTRVVIDFLLKINPNLNLKMFNFLGKTNIPFLRGRFFAYGFSVLVLGIGLSSIMARGHSNYGVEFTGGMLAQIQFQKNIEIADLRRGLEEAGAKSPVIQHFGNPEENQFIIKTADSDTHNVEAVGAKLSGEKGYKLLRVDRVGPSVSQDLTKKALYAVLWSAFGILLYLAWRFEWRFALAAVVALFHDTLFAFGVYALAGREINLTSIAAILTIMGFSVNDTIVTFDRVRDNLKIHRKKPFSEVVTISINETLSRTIITSMTVMFSTLALFLFGGDSINDFAFILLVGFGVGIYSTIFVATSLVVDWKGKGR
nr:protein translocase subunit SecF [Candidatus Omnitrophota bacterium]